MDKINLPVIIASYNRPNLIRQTIESCLKNSYHNVELIVVDNSDDSETIKYLEFLENITLFRWPKLKHFPHLQSATGEVFTPFKGCLPHTPFYHNDWSLGKQRTIGEMIAPPSKYIYFSDNDMYFMPNWDKVMVETLEKYEDLVMVGGSGQHSSEFYAKFDEEYDVHWVSKQVGNTALFRREEWAKIGYFPDYDEDSWMGGEIQSRFQKKLSVIQPDIVIHCGENSIIKGGVRTKGVVKTHDMPAIEKYKLKYPEMVFE